MPRIDLGLTAFDRMNGNSGHGLAGIFLFTRGEPQPWHDGIRTAVFRTWEEAKSVLRGSPIKKTWTRAKVVKVKVEVAVV